MKKEYFIAILLLTIYLLCFAKSRVNRRIFSNNPTLHEFKIIEEVELEKPRSNTRLSLSNFEESGCLSTNAILRSHESEVNVYSYYGRKEKVDQIRRTGRLLMISESGQFMLYKDELKKNEFTIVGRNNEILSVFSDSILVGDQSWILEITDKGKILYTESLNYVNLMSLNGSITKFGPFYEEETLSKYIPGNGAEFVEIAENGKLVVLVTEFFHIKPENYKSFPQGARIFFYDTNGELMNYHDLPDPNEITLPFKMSRSGKYVVARVGSQAYIFKNGEIIFNEDVKLLGGINFSEDESLAILGTHSGTLIIDLETAKVIKKGVIKGYNKCVANKGFPYISSISRNNLYIYNYEDMKIIFTDFIGTPVANGNDLLQISGDGKMISVVHDNFYRKYYAGK